VTPPRQTADLLIVGSGIMGSVVARLVRETSPATRIVMVDDPELLHGHRTHTIPFA
jgi:L-2-hydroxyglutarate oxidase LhgO